MDTENLTDETIRLLLDEPKIVVSKKAKVTPKKKHREINLTVESRDGVHTYTLFVRQSTVIGNSFSCGLVLQRKSGDITLTRYNGSDHSHTNSIEGNKIDHHYHIHKATERYISKGKRAESYAEKTERYQDSDGALQCLLADCHIAGYPDSDTRQLSLVLET